MASHWLPAAALALLSALLAGCAADPGVCGDGVVTSGETCDDGNTAAGDGCGATCQVEPGWCCIDGLACVQEGATAPGTPCLACVPGVAATAWTPTTAGCGVECVTDFDCNDQAVCTIDVCARGHCNHTRKHGCIEP